MTYTPPEQPAQQPVQSTGGYQAYTPSGQSYAPIGQTYGNYAVTSTKKTLSLWGLILGISSIVLPLFINGVAGAVLSGIGLAKEPAGKKMAIWGLVLSILGFIWAFVFWPLLFTAIFAAAVAAVYDY